MTHHIQYRTVLAAAILSAVHAPLVYAQAGAFEQALASDYQALSTAERAQGDERDALTYARRATAATEGQPTAPEQVELRLPFLKDKYVSELSQARARLVTALDNAGRTNAPADAARAQASYDCWLEQSSEDLQPEDIAACRNSFMTAIGKVEDAAAEEVAPAPPVVAAEPTYPEKFLVFFDFDRAEVTPEGRSVIDSAIAAAGGKPFRQIVATGHADKSGSDSYNMALSNRRAEAVKSALTRAGLQTDSIETEARGEAEPLVQTADGVREAQNRRVEILIER